MCQQLSDKEFETFCIENQGMCAHHEMAVVVILIEPRNVECLSLGGVEWHDAGKLHPFFDLGPPLILGQRSHVVRRNAE
jgi:hypothetical protein